MKHLCLLLLFVGTFYCTQAVDTLKTARPNESYNAIKLGATTVSVMIPMVQVGFEHRWNRYSWQTTIGSIIPKPYIVDDSIRGTTSGFSLRLDGRLHNHNPSHSGLFIGVGLFYTWFKHPHAGRFADSQTALSDPRSDWDTYLLNKSTLGLVVQLGGHHYIGKHLDVELSVGVGPKVMFTSQIGRNDPNSEYASRHSNIHDIESQLGTVWAAAIQGQVSVGYIFGK
ncbi:MAG: hypothetical protein H6551_08905 [Chitinophagales bacterium]|nr:hypothetical protein [Chitinophagaceae bacterium]MCB9065240.1 hypothetical protein [Chitinophagales bacterium]